VKFAPEGWGKSENLASFLPLWLIPVFANWPRKHFDKHLFCPLNNMKKNRYWIQIPLFTGLGLVLGIIILSIILHFEHVQSVIKIAEMIHKPAIWCANYWSYVLRLPPQNEAAFAVVPMVTVVFQWVFIIFILGVWRFTHLRRK
jgi:hypothetical protein